MHILVWKQNDLWKSRPMVSAFCPQPLVWLNNTVIKEDIGITEVRYVLPPYQKFPEEKEICSHWNVNVEKYLKLVTETVKFKPCLCSEVWSSHYRKFQENITSWYSRKNKAHMSFQTKRLECCFPTPVSLVLVSQWPSSRLSNPYLK